MKYGNQLVESACGPDLLALGVFPNFKEVTESFAAHSAASKYLRHHFRLGDPSVTLLAVGDGCTPRTGATFAYRSAWRCISVDPTLRIQNTRWSRVRRLELRRCRIEQTTIPGRRVVIAAVHSHANLAASIAACTEAEELGIVAIPCCVPLTLATAPDVEFQDAGILSPERTVRVWRCAPPIKRAV